MEFPFSISRLDGSQCQLDLVEAQKVTEVFTSLGAPVLAPLIIQEFFSMSPFLVLRDSFSTCKQVQGSIHPGLHSEDQKCRLKKRIWLIPSNDDLKYNHQPVTHAWICQESCTKYQ